MTRPTVRTELFDRLGIEYPMVLAGMGPAAGTGDPVATAELVAAVSTAGGLGVHPRRTACERRSVRSGQPKPVLAGGGIASGRALAGVLALDDA